MNAHQRRVRRRRQARQVAARYVALFAMADASAAVVRTFRRLSAGVAHLNVDAQLPGSVTLPPFAFAIEIGQIEGETKEA